MQHLQVSNLSGQNNVYASQAQDPAPFMQVAQCILRFNSHIGRVQLQSKCSLAQPDQNK